MTLCNPIKNRSIRPLVIECLIIVIVLTYLSSRIPSSSAFILKTQQQSQYRKLNVERTSTSTSSSSNDMAPASTTTTVKGEEKKSSLVEDNTDFLVRAKKLCDERNIKFDKVKNARDLSSPVYSTIKPGILYRTGRVSDATANDIQIMFNQLNIQTLIDLRSPTELKDDPTLLRSDVFQNFTSLVWQERRAGKANCLKELPYNEPPFTRRKKNSFWSRISSSSSSTDVTATDPTSTAPDVDADVLEKALLNEKAIVVNDNDAIIFDSIDDDDDDDDDLDCSAECLQGLEILKKTSTPCRKERYFVSLMNEFKYVKGTVSKVRKRDITKALLKAPGAVFSKRVRASLKKPFLDEINDGGLPMLNELLLRFGSPGIRYVLELCADETHHPVAFYCTAGKDRTGIISAIILTLCTVPEESIIEDYSLSANVYAEMNDHTAMVGALSQRSLDPKRFLIAPPSVMKDILHTINEQYGSVQEYCTWIGFTPEKQQQLRKACMIQPE